MSEAENIEKPMSFREAKATELREEWFGKREAQPSSEDRERVTAPTPAEDDYEDVVEVEDNSPDAEAQTDDSELEYEPTDEDGAEEESEADDYKTKYETLEKEYRRVTANRKQIEADRAEEAEAFVRLRHEFDDSIGQARQGAEYYANLANQQLMQLQQINPQTLAPEQQAQYYQQLNMATQNAQQQKTALENFRKFEAEQKEVARRKEAEIASARLKASIPEWSNEHYAELGRVAVDSGFTAEEFADITDYRVIQLLHSQWKSQKASEAVKQTVKQRKAQPPQSRAANQQPRNKRGQYEKAKKDFQPNQRGSFAAMKQAQWEADRR